MLGLLDKKARLTMFFFIIGMTVCLWISQVNSLLLAEFQNRTFYVTTTVTPITEELIKGLPVLLFAFCVSDDRTKLLNISMAVGIGFAILENAFMLATSSEVTVIWALIRAFGAGLMHGICTASVGFAMSFIRKKQKLFLPGTFAVLTTAIVYHAIYNALVQSPNPYIGILLPICTYIPIVIWFVRTKKKSSADKA